jgi:hypothetical protein
MAVMHRAYCSFHCGWSFREQFPFRVLGRPLGAGFFWAVSCMESKIFTPEDTEDTEDWRKTTRAHKTRGSGVFWLTR